MFVGLIFVIMKENIENLWLSVKNYSINIFMNNTYIQTTFGHLYLTYNYFEAQCEYNYNKIKKVSSIYYNKNQKYFDSFFKVIQPLLYYIQYESINIPTIMIIDDHGKEIDGTKIPISNKKYLYLYKYNKKYNTWWWWHKDKLSKSLFLTEYLTDKEMDEIDNNNVFNKSYNEIEKCIIKSPFILLHYIDFDLDKYYTIPISLLDNKEYTFLINNNVITKQLIFYILLNNNKILSNQTNLKISGSFISTNGKFTKIDLNEYYIIINNGKCDAVKI